MSKRKASASHATIYTGIRAMYVDAGGVHAPVTVTVATGLVAIYSASSNRPSRRLSRLSMLMAQPKKYRMIGEMAVSPAMMMVRADFSQSGQRDHGHEDIAATLSQS